MSTRIREQELERYVWKLNGKFHREDGPIA